MIFEELQVSLTYPLYPVVQAISWTIAFDLIVIRVLAKPNREECPRQPFLCGSQIRYSAEAYFSILLYRQRRRLPIKFQFA